MQQNSHCRAFVVSLPLLSPNRIGVLFFLFDKLMMADAIRGAFAEPYGVPSGGNAPVAPVNAPSAL